MEQRRNTCTAVFFLAALLGTVLFLAAGLLPRQSGFLKTEKTAVPTLSARSAEEETTLTKDRSAPTLSHGLSPLHYAAQDLGRFWEQVDENSDSIDAALNEALDRDHLFIQAYGAAQRLLGKTVVEDVESKYTVVDLGDGFLTFADPNAQPQDMTVRAHEMADFAQLLSEELDKPLLYVQAPGKTDVADLPEGIPDCSTQEADQFLALLEGTQVDTLDLRPAFHEAAQEHPDQARELFYATDHHWSPAGAFLSYQSLCEKLEQDYGFSLDENFLFKENFTVTTFQDVFLGSQGKRVGSLYVQPDDVEVWTPKADTDFTYTAPSEGVSRSGPFALSLLFPELLSESGLYDTNPYVVYAGGDYFLSRAVNKLKPDAPRVLVLRDSYGCALTPFLALQCGEVMTMDPRLYDGDAQDLLSSIRWLDPDLVIVLNSTSSLTADQLYPYLPTARAAVLAQRAEAE